MSPVGRGPVIRGAMWLGSSRLAINAIGFVSTLVLARLLSPGDFGLVAIAEAIFAIAGAITQLSLAQSLVQHREPQAHHFNTAFTLNIGRSVLLGAAIAVASIPAAQVYGDPRLRDVMLVLAAATAFGGLENPRLVVFERDLIFWQNFLLNVGSKLAGFVVAIAIAYAYRSYWALVLGSFVAQGVRVALSYVVLPNLPRPSLAGARELLSFSGWLTLTSGLKTATMRYDPLLLGLAVPQASVGHYTFGSRLGSLPVRESLTPLRSLLFPALSRMQDEPLRLRHAYRNAQGVIFFIAMPLAVGFALVAEPVVLLTIGEKWLPAVLVMQAIAILSALNQLENLEPLAMALGKTKRLFRRELRVFLIRLPLVTGGLLLGQATFIGVVMGVVLGRFLATLVNIALNMKLVETLAGDTVREQLRIAPRPIIASGIMAAGIALLFGVPGASGDTVALIAHLLMVVPAGVALYGAATLVLWLALERPDGAEREILSSLRTARHRILRR